MKEKILNRGDKLVEKGEQFSSQSISPFSNNVFIFRQFQRHRNVKTTVKSDTSVKTMAILNLIKSIVDETLLAINDHNEKHYGNLKLNRWIVRYLT